MATIKIEDLENKMTKKNYEAAALIIRNTKRYSGTRTALIRSEKSRMRLAETFISFFEADNVRFDRARFLEACAFNI